MRALASQLRGSPACRRARTDSPTPGLRPTDGYGGPDMRQRIRSHLTYANVMASLAVFLVLSGGTAIALDGSNTVFSDDIVDGEVKTADLAGNSVGSNKINNGAVATADLGADSVSSAKVADGALTGQDVADDTLTTSDIDNSLTAADLQGIVIFAAADTAR